MKWNIQGGNLFVPAAWLDRGEVRFWWVTLDDNSVDQELVSSIDSGVAPEGVTMTEDDIVADMCKIILRGVGSRTRILSQGSNEDGVVVSTIHRGQVLAADLAQRAVDAVDYVVGTSDTYNRIGDAAARLLMRSRQNQVIMRRFSGSDIVAKKADSTSKFERIPAERIAQFQDRFTSTLGANQTACMASSAGVENELRLRVLDQATDISVGSSAKRRFPLLHVYDSTGALRVRTGPIIPSGETRVDYSGTDNANVVLQSTDSESVSEQRFVLRSDIVVPCRLLTTGKPLSFDTSVANITHVYSEVSGVALTDSGKKSIEDAFETASDPLFGCGQGWWRGFLLNSEEAYATVPLQAEAVAKGAWQTLPQVNDIPIDLLIQTTHVSSKYALPKWIRDRTVALNSILMALTLLSLCILLWLWSSSNHQVSTAWGTSTPEATTAAAPKTLQAKKLLSYAQDVQNLWYKDGADYMYPRTSLSNDRSLRERAFEWKQETDRRSRLFQQ